MSLVCEWGLNKLRIFRGANILFQYRAVASTLTRSIYGHKPKSMNDSLIEDVRSLFSYVSKAALTSSKFPFAVDTGPMRLD